MNALDAPSRTTWQHRFAHVAGVRMHWAELGESAGNPPLVLLHGLTDCYRSWGRLAPRLAHDRRVLIPDLPGHGLSSRPDATYELRWYADVLAAWMEAAGVDRADVVGHSFGGGVAQMMLLRCPQRIRRLVLVASGGLGREVNLSLRLASLPFVVEFLGQPFMGACTRLVLKAFGSTHSSEDRARLGAMNAQPGSARALARTVRDIVDWRGQRRTFLQHAGELRVLPPIAVFWGDRDEVIPFAHAGALAKAVAGVRVTRFEACGHYPHQQKPDAFAGALLEFLDSHDAPVASWRDPVPVASRVRPALAPRPSVVLLPVPVVS